MTKKTGLPDPRPGGSLATVHDIREASSSEKLVAWVASGFGALAAVLGVCGALVGGSWFIIDRAEAQGRAASESVSRELHQHIEEEKKDLAALRRTLERQDQKTDAILLGLGLRNPAPAPKPEDAGR